MQPVLSIDVQARINKILVNAARRARRSQKRDEQLRAERSKCSIRHRREAMIEQHDRRRRMVREIDRALEGLKALFGFAQSAPIRMLLESESNNLSVLVEFKRFQFYLASSRREDAPDSVAIYFTLEGISVYGGCENANDFEEYAFFPFDSSDAHIREELGKIAREYETDEAFLSLSDQSSVSYEWSFPASDIGFQVLVDCRKPERLEKYIDAALRNLERAVRAH